MEFKVILYVIGAIIWAAYNYVKNKQDVFKPKLPKTEFEKEIKPSIEIKKEEKIPNISSRRAILEKQRKVEKTQRTFAIEGPEKTNSDETNLYANTKLTKEFSTKENITKINSTEFFEPQISVGELIGNELRNEEYDLKRAIVYSEILKPAFLKA